MTNSEHRQFAPSVARNRQPILDIIKPRLETGADVLEIAAGSGEHAVFLAPALAVNTWQPSDLSPPALQSINAWRFHSGLMDVIRPPVQLDMTRPTEALQSQLKQASAPASYDLITCINMIHISPWSATEGLMRHTATLLKPGGLLYLYGPYIQKGRPTAPSNLSFDASLRERNPDWGIRQLDDVIDLASVQGLSFLDSYPMPANNLSVFFSR